MKEELKVTQEEFDRQEVLAEIRVTKGEEHTRVAIQGDSSDIFSLMCVAIESIGKSADLEPLEVNSIIQQMLETSAGLDKEEN